MDKFHPTHIVVDSEMVDSENTIVRIHREETWHPNNAIPEAPWKETTLVGNVSRGAMNLLAEFFDYECTWLDWSQYESDLGIEDYATRKRFTCILHK